MCKRLGLGILFLAASVVTSSARAAIVTYDASTNLLPQSVGWTYTSAGVAPTVFVGGGILTLDAPTVRGSRGFWSFDVGTVTGTPSGSGIFMEVEVRIVSESHTNSNRGLDIIELADTNGVVSSEVDTWAWTNRIFSNDTSDTTAVSKGIDTTDGFHTYRVELLGDKFWVFRDGAQLMHGISPFVPFGTTSGPNDFYGFFGDTSGGSGSYSEWKKVTIGSLADIGGPTVPEPTSIALLSLGGVGVLLGRRRRALR